MSPFTMLEAAIDKASESLGPAGLRELADQLERRADLLRVEADNMAEDQARFAEAGDDE